MLPNNINPSGAVIAACDENNACEVLSCEVCLSEVPADIASTYEGPDYVHHFCGLDCLEKWREKSKKSDNP